MEPHEYSPPTRYGYDGAQSRMKFVIVWHNAEQYAMSKGHPRDEAQEYADFVLDAIAGGKDTYPGIDQNHVALYGPWKDNR